MNFNILYEKLSAMVGGVGGSPTPFLMLLLAGLPRRVSRRVAARLLVRYVPILDERRARVWARAALVTPGGSWEDDSQVRRIPDWVDRPQDRVFVDALLSYGSSVIQRPAGLQWISVYQLTFAVQGGIHARAVNAWAADDPGAVRAHYRQGKPGALFCSSLFQFVQRREWAAVVQEIGSQAKAFDPEAAAADGRPAREAWVANDGVLHLGANPVFRQPSEPSGGML